MENAAQNLNPTNAELGGSVDKAPTPPSYITGGCLCGNVRYKAEIGNKYAWPPGPHTCSCTHCRKHTGAPFALFLTFTCAQLGWPNPLLDVPGQANTSADKVQTPSMAAGYKYEVSDIPPWRPGNLPITEYSHTPGRYRGFCETCGSTLYWRCPDEDGYEIEMVVGTVDEELLQKYGKELCEPRRGRYYSGREVHGVGFGGDFKGGNSGQRFKEGSRSDTINC